MQLVKRIISAVIMLSLLLAADVYADVNEVPGGIYVDILQGSDSNSGTEYEPFKSLGCASAAAQKQSGNQNIVLSDGVYDVRDLSELSAANGKYISYTAMNAKAPVIRQQEGRAVQIKNVAFNGVTFEGPYGIKLFDCENVVFNNCVFKNCETVAVEISGKCKNITIENSSFCDNLISSLVINDGKKPQDAPLNCTIKNNEFLNCSLNASSESVVKIESGNGCRFISNTVSGFSGYAILCGQSYNTSQTYKTLTDIEISNNFIYTKNAACAPIKIFGVNGAQALKPNLLNGNFIMTDYSPDIWAIELLSSAKYWYVMQNVIQGFGNAVKLNAVTKSTISINETYCDIYKQSPLITDVEDTINYRCFNGMRSQSAKDASQKIINNSGAKNADSDYLMRVMPEKRFYELYPKETVQINTAAYNAEGNIIKDGISVAYEVIGDNDNIEVSENGVVTVKKIPLGDIRVSVTYKGKTLDTIVRVEEKIKNDVNSILYTTAGIIKPFSYYSKFFSAQVHNYMEFSKNGTTEYSLNIPEGSGYRLYMSALNDMNMGIFRIYVNGQPLNSEFDFYGDEKMQIYDLGEINTLNKKATVKIECIGRNPLSAGTAFLLKGFHIGKISI